MLLLLAAPTASLYAQTIAGDDPVLWYRMDATSGSTEVDHGSAGHNGTYVNSPTLNQVGAIDDGNPAVEFAKASSQQLTGADDASYSISSTGFSVEYWASFPSENTGVAQRIFTKFNSTGSQCEWACERFNSGVYAFRVFPGSATFLASATFSTSPVSLDTFHYFVATVDNTGTVKTYLDGVLADTKTFTFASRLANGTAAVVIGGSEETGWNCDATIDEVAIYNFVLSEAQVQNHYAARNGGDNTADPGDYGNDEYGEGLYGIGHLASGGGGGSIPVIVGVTPVALDVIFSRHPASVLGTGNNADLIVNGPEAV